MAQRGDDNTPEDRDLLEQILLETSVQSPHGSDHALDGGETPASVPPHK